MPSAKTPVRILARRLDILRKAEPHGAAMTPAGLEPAIPGSVGRCLIHWATGPLQQHRPIARQPTPRRIKDIQHLCTRYMRHPGGGGAATAIGHLPPTDGPSSLDPHLHRSHFGSRYTLGCCSHAGLFLHVPLQANKQTERHTSRPTDRQRHTHTSMTSTSPWHAL